MHIYDEDMKRIVAAVRAAEEKTTGEIVPVLAQESDTYRFIPTLWAALLALIAPAILIPFAPDIPLWEGYALQILIFTAFVALFQIRAIHLWLVPKSVKKRRAARMAYMQFHRIGLHETKDRGGVLIFVSLAERHIEILADVGINRYVTPSVWQEIVAEFSVAVGKGDLVSGYERAIQRCGSILAEHMPTEKESRNELADGLVVI